MENDELIKSIGNRIYKLRVGEQSGEVGQITIIELLNALSDLGITISQGKLSNIERGKTEPSLGLLIGIAAALSNLRKKKVYLHDLLPQSGQVAISSRWSCDSDEIRGFVDGKPVIANIAKAPEKSEKESVSPSLKRATERINYLLNTYRKEPTKQHFDISPVEFEEEVRKLYGGKDLDEASLDLAQGGDSSKKVTWQAKGRQTTKIIEQVAHAIDSDWVKKPYQTRKK